MRSDKHRRPAERNRRPPEKTTGTWLKAKPIRAIIFLLLCISSLSGQVTEVEDVLSVAEDERQDFLLDHPAFERRFGTAFTSNEAVPNALDILAVRVSSAGDFFRFQIRTAAPLRPLFEEFGASVQVGIFIDTDVDGVSEILVTTSGEDVTSGEESRGLAVRTPELRPIRRVRVPVLMLEGGGLQFLVAKSLTGEAFDWLVFTGLARAPGRPFRSVEGVRLAPVLDIATPGPATCSAVEAVVAGPASLQGAKAKKVPVPPGTPRTGDAGGPRGPTGNPINDWRQQVQTIGGVQVENWVISTDPAGPSGADFFGIKAFRDRNGNGVQDAGEPGGWIGRCPFDRGDNELTKDDENLDGIIDLVTWTSTDLGTDDDGDGLKDIMTYTYNVGPDRVVIVNSERDSRGLIVADRQTISAPFTDPASVPKSVP